MLLDARANEVLDGPGARIKFSSPESKYASLKKVLAILLGLFGAPQSFGALGIVPPFHSLGTPLPRSKHGRIHMMLKGPAPDKVHKNFIS